MAELFDLCVGAMYLMSDITGLTYKEINIWLFVIIHPVITLTLFILLVFKQRKINHYEKTYEMEWGQGNSLDDLIKYKKTSEDLDFEMSLQEQEEEEFNRELEEYIYRHHDNLFPPKENLKTYEDEDRILESIEAERNRYFVTECEIERREIVDLIKKLAKSLNSLSDEEFEKILKSDPFS